MLNPVLRMEEQFCDVLLAHNPGMTRYEAIKRAQELLEIVDIHPSRLKDYPHQFSGGMRQRLVIAIAMALNPELLIMDEPTTALDVVVQREILQKVYALKAKFNFSILFITHDLSLMVEFCDRIGIMYAGELVEVAPAKAILTAPPAPLHQKAWHLSPAGQDRAGGDPGSPSTCWRCRSAAASRHAAPRCTRCRQEYTASPRSGPAIRLPATFMRQQRNNRIFRSIWTRPLAVKDVCHANRPNRRAHHRGPAPLQGLRRQLQRHQERQDAGAVRHHLQPAPGPRPGSGGESGSGKSTIAKIIAKMYKLSNGRIL
jgi:ABC-type dipeptide/oligopeptide/nickel transport system ATPase component